MLSLLPVEIQIRLVELDPRSHLKHTNSHFYTLYNNLFYDKIINVFGEDILQVLARILPFVIPYIRSLDLFRYTARRAIASRLGLDDDAPFSPNEVDKNHLDRAFVKDSWKYIHSVLFNRRLFAEQSDYQIDEPVNYVYNHYVEINRTYLLSYVKSFWLAPGKYNLNIGLVVTHGSGLGTTKFELGYRTDDGLKVTSAFYPPTNINNILPKNQFCLLKIAEFEIPKHNNSKRSNQCYQVELIMEEIGLYLKLGFRIYFIDVAQQLMLFNEYDLLYYTVRETDYQFFINLPLKNLYKALSYTQGTDKNSYGSGDPFEPDTVYDLTLPGADPKDVTTESCLKNSRGIDFSKIYDLEALRQYGDLFFNRNFRRRKYKFNTIYQQRQFINRFGDFLLDWSNEEQDPSNPNYRRSCRYDVRGLRWKIPILGEM